MKLDEPDEAHTPMLQEDGRRSLAEIAKSLDQSESTVRFRFKRLVDGGVIRSMIALVNPRAVGQRVGALFIKANALKLDDALRDFCSPIEVPHICQFTGDYAAIAIIMGHDVDALNTLVRRMKSISGVVDVTMMLALRVMKSDVKYAIVRRWKISDDEARAESCGEWTLAVEVYLSSIRAHHPAEG
jgi:DNA-binding Lrp family transcriptional regulator